MVRKDEEKGNNRAGHATFDQQLDNGTTLWKCNRRQLCGFPYCRNSCGMCPALVKQTCHIYLDGETIRIESWNNKCAE